MNLFELAETIEKLGGVESLSIISEHLDDLKTRISALEVAEGKDKVELADKILFLEERNRHLEEQISIPNEDRMEVTQERLRQIRAKMSRQYKEICRLQEKLIDKD